MIKDYNKVQSMILSTQWVYQIIIQYVPCAGYSKNDPKEA